VLWRNDTGQSTGGGIVTYIAGGRQLVGVASGAQQSRIPRLRAAMNHDDRGNGDIMSGAHSDQDARSRADERPTEPVRYPTHHVVAVLATEDQVADAAGALIGGGFLASEVDVATGSAAADRVAASVGRRGLRGLAIRVAERLGMTDEEMEIKAHYEQAMRDGQFVLRVDASTDARKDVATNILSQHGAHSVNYFGRFTIETIVPPDGS
jgi:hypothetical protein